MVISRALHIGPRRPVAHSGSGNRPIERTSTTDSWPRPWHVGSSPQLDRYQFQRRLEIRQDVEVAAKDGPRNRRRPTSHAAVQPAQDNPAVPAVNPKVAADGHRDEVQTTGLEARPPPPHGELGRVHARGGEATGVRIPASGESRPDTDH